MKNATLTSTSSLSLLSNTYVYDIIPHDTHLAAILSDDSLRIVNSNTLQEIPDGVLPNAHKGIACLAPSTNPSSSLLTAGRDGLVIQWDLRSRKKAAEFRDASNAAYLSVCQTINGPAVGTELTNSQASVLIWDARYPTTSKITYTESHNDDITVVKPHPTSPSTLLSASTDGLLNIYDLNAPSPDPDDEALVQIKNHAHSIHRAGFLTPDAKQFFALSNDEHFSVYDLEGAGDGASQGKAFGDLRERLECDYVVDVWTGFDGGDGMREEEVFLGAGSHSGCWLNLVPLVVKEGGWEVDAERTIRLPGGHGEDVVRSFCLGQGGRIVWTAGEDGKIRSWRVDSEQDDGEMKVEDEDEKEKIKRKGKKEKTRGKDDDRGQGRFKPY